MHRYRAFISYSHRDIDFARRLQDWLEKLNIPTADGGLEKFSPVYRDETELAAGPLPERLKAALSQSDALIVISSPAAAASKWVNEEIQTFRTLRPDARACAILAPGFPSEEHPSASCFPARLRDHDAHLFAPSVSQFGEEGAFLRLVAGVLGIELRELSDRHAEAELKERRRLQRLTGSGFVDLVREKMNLHQPERAMRLLAASVALTGDTKFEIVPELWAYGARSIASSRLRAVFPKQGPDDPCFHRLHPQLMMSCEQDEGYVANVLTGEIISRTGGVSRAVGFHPTDDAALYRLKDETFALCDAETGEIIRRYRCGERRYITAQFSGDGALLLANAFSGRNGPEVHTLWRTDDGSVIAEHGHEGERIDKARFINNDGDIAFYFSRYAREQLEPLVWRALDFSGSPAPPAPHLPEDDDDRAAQAFEMSFEDSDAKLHTRPVIASIHDGVFRLQDPSGAHLRRIRRSEHIYKFVIGPLRDRVALIGLNGTTAVHELHTGRELYSAESQGGTSVPSARFAADGRRLLTWTFHDPVRAWDNAGRATIHRLADTGQSACEASFHPSEERVIAAYDEGLIIQWNSATAEIITHQPLQIPVRGVSYAPDGESWFAFGGQRKEFMGDAPARNGTFAEVSLATGNIIHSIVDDDGDIICAAIAPDNSSIALFFKGRKLKLYSRDGGRLLFEKQMDEMMLRPEIGPPNRVVMVRGGGSGARTAQIAYTADGKALFLNTVARIYRLDTKSLDLVELKLNRKLSHKMNGVRCVDDSLYVAGEGACYKLDHNGQLLLTLKPAEQAKNSRSYGAMSISADRHRLAVSDGMQVQIFDTTHGAELLALGNRGVEIKSIAFDPTGRRIVTAEADGVCRIMDTLGAHAYQGNPLRYLIGAMENRLGLRISSERKSLMMSEAPDDIYEALVNSWPHEAPGPDEARVSTSLSHDNCYERLPWIAQPKE